MIHFPKYKKLFKSGLFFRAQKVTSWNIRKLKHHYFEGGRGGGGGGGGFRFRKYREAFSWGNIRNFLILELESSFFLVHFLGVDLFYFFELGLKSSIFQNGRRFLGFPFSETGGNFFGVSISQSITKYKKFLI